MEPLTKEYFDQHISKLTEDIGGIHTRMATKDDIRAAVDELAGMVERGFADLSERLDVREQVEQHDRDIQLIKQALKLA